VKWQVFNLPRKTLHGFRRKPNIPSSVTFGDSFPQRGKPFFVADHIAIKK